MSSRAKRGDLSIRNRNFFLINSDISDTIIQAVFCMRGVKEWQTLNLQRKEFM